MFEQSVLRERKRNRRGWIVALAAGIHAAALGTVVLASAWSVDEVAPPTETVPFTRPMDVTYLAFQEPRHETAPPPVERRPVAPPEHRDAGPTQPAPPVVQPSTVPETLPTAPAGPELAPATGSDVDAPPAPSGGDGTDPNGPAWSGGGDGEVAQALDARMTRPQLLFRITPRYTESARRAHREGVVVVQATIDRTGAVTDVRLMKALGLGLDEEAMNAVRQWRYTPATLAGRPVPVFFQLTVTFTIR